VNRRPVVVEDTGVRSLAIPFAIYDEKSGTRSTFGPTTSLSAVSIIPTTLYTHSIICVQLYAFLEIDSVIRQHTGRSHCHPGDGQRAHGNPKFWETWSRLAQRV
jgi:hypothetical protein